MKLEQIHHVAIIVSDYARAKAFYVDKLGLEVVRETRRPERGDIKLDLRLGACELELFYKPDALRRPTRPEACGLRHLAFSVADVDAAVDWLRGLGIETEPVRLDPLTGEKITFFFDPDGLPLELHGGHSPL